MNSLATQYRWNINDSYLQYPSFQPEFSGCFFNVYIQMPFHVLVQEDVRMEAVWKENAGIQWFSSN